MLAAARCQPSVHDQASAKGIPLMMTVSVVSDTLTPALARLKESLSNPAPAMRTIANILDRSVKANFRAAGRPVKWKPLAPSTAKGKITKTQRRGYANILRPTGDNIFKRIQSRSSRYTAEIGAPGVVPTVHQLGTNRAGRGRHTTIPKRTFIGRSDRPQTTSFDLLPEDEQAIVKAIDAHIMRGQK